jgi:hypothetical protein
MNCAQVQNLKCQPSCVTFFYLPHILFLYGGRKIWQTMKTKSNLFFGVFFWLKAILNATKNNINFQKYK